MDDLFINTEEQFYAALIANRSDVSLFIVNGIQLKGKLVSATEFCVFLKKNDAAPTLANTSLVYKSAISSIVPITFGEPTSLTERELHGVLSANRRQ